MLAVIVVSISIITPGTYYFHLLVHKYTKETPPATVRGEYTISVWNGDFNRSPMTSVLNRVNSSGLMEKPGFGTSHISMSVWGSAEHLKVYGHTDFDLYVEINGSLDPPSSLKSFFIDQNLTMYHPSSPNITGNWETLSLGNSISNLTLNSIQYQYPPSLKFGMTSEWSVDTQAKQYNNPVNFSAIIPARMAVNGIGIGDSFTLLFASNLDGILLETSILVIDTEP